MANLEDMSVSMPPPVLRIIDTASSSNRSIVCAVAPPETSKFSTLLNMPVPATSLIAKMALLESPVNDIFCTLASARTTTNVSTPSPPSIVSLSELLIRTSLPEEPVKILVPAPPSSCTLTTDSETPSNSPV